MWCAHTKCGRISGSKCPQGMRPLSVGVCHPEAGSSGIQDGSRRPLGLLASLFTLGRRRGLFLFCLEQGSLAQPYLSHHRWLPRGCHSCSDLGSALWSHDHVITFFFLFLFNWFKKWKPFSAPGSYKNRRWVTVYSPWSRVIVRVGRVTPNVWCR